MAKNGSCTRHKNNISDTVGPFFFSDTDIRNVRDVLPPTLGHPIFVLEDIPGGQKKDPSKQARHDDSTTAGETRNSELRPATVTNIFIHIHSHRRSKPRRVLFCRIFCMKNFYCEKIICRTSVQTLISQIEDKVTKVHTHV